MTPPARTPLGRRAVAASGWQLVAVGGQLVLQVVVLAVLSRHVTPEEFGLVAVAMIGIALARQLTELGLVAALVQRPELTPDHHRAAFSLSLVFGALLTCLTWFGAPGWAELFAMPGVEPVVRVLSASFLAVSVGLVATGVLLRELNLRATSLCELASYAFGYGCVGIPLALDGQGALALAFAIATQSIVRSALLLALVRHSLRPARPGRAMAELLSFGFGMTLVRLANFAATRGDYVIVGRWLGGEALGFYERAYKVVDLAANAFAGVLDKVLFPSMAEIGEDPKRLLRIYLAATTLVGLVYLPAAALLFVLARPLTLVVFGPQWEGTVPALQVMAVGLIFRSGYKVSDSLARAIGAVYRAAWRVAVYAAAVVVGAFLGKAWGIVGVAWAVVCAMGWRHLSMSQLCVRHVGGGWRDLLRTQRAGGAVAMTLAATVLGLEKLLLLFAAPALLWWPVLLCGTVASGLAILWFLPRGWLGDDLLRWLEAARSFSPITGSRSASLAG